MRLVKVGAASLNQTPFDWDNNQANILEAIDAAKADGVAVLCLPELCICGYGCEDAFHSPGLRRMARKVLDDIVPATNGIAVSLGLPVLYNNGLYNTVCLAVDGRIVGFAAKRHLAGEGLHYEPRWFKPWPEGVVATIELDGQALPIGDLHFEVGPIKIGFEICEDAWVAKRPGAGLAEHGVDIILNPSASHFAFGKFETRKRFVLEGSRAFGVTYVYSNLLGNEAGRAIYDGGAMIASAGKLAAVGERFGYRPVALTTAVVDVDATRMSQARTGSFSPSVERDQRCVTVGFELPDAELAKDQVSFAEWEGRDRIEFEELTRALGLALFDYMRKTRSHGFVVSLSGGADSASVACLVAMMVRMACEQIGIEAFKSRLSYTHIEGNDVAGIVHSLLTCVYQSTRNSSQTTRSAARGVAEAIGAEFLEFDVQPLVDEYVDLVSAGVGRKLTWAADDTALQNIQARVRGPGAWMLANLKGALLAATSNRSEAAVGYATMDGDTCGGISPIAGIDKAFIRKWLRWMETAGPKGMGPIPALGPVNTQQPTAELRPTEAGQTDEDDLMPYELLGAIEDAAIGQKKTPVEVFQLIRTQFGDQAGYDDRQLLQWIERFYRLWCRNQWKRERYAPSFHVDDKNLDPKTWCRFPILSGEFDRELAELRAFVEGG